MPRNDGLLYTGMSSVTERRLQERRDKLAEAKEAKRNELVPKADAVLEEIEREKSNILDLRTFVIDRETTEQAVNVDLLARKRYYNYLTELQNKLKIVLKQPKTKKLPEPEDDED